MQGCRRCVGIQVLVVHLTLYQPERADCAPNFNTCPPSLRQRPTALVCIYLVKKLKRCTLRPKWSELTSKACRFLKIIRWCSAAELSSLFAVEAKLSKAHCQFFNNKKRFLLWRPDCFPTKLTVCKAGVEPAPDSTLFAGAKLRSVKESSSIFQRVKLWKSK